ncbi:hypothetical protein [Lysinibacillus cavernae]|uniref:tubby C-terminal domain-like protein n=1 Tax=Lysinibacillus cavernae TaxID=2666135 RepID=UPI0012D9A15C|nr:hypothetical protein [Lysinibacillus cavernae]
MTTFTLTYPKGFKSFTTIPIVNDYNETVCVLQKVERSSAGKVLNAVMLVAAQQTLPYRYETRTILGAPLFQVQSTLFTKGVDYQIIMPDSSCIPIQRKTVQLLESSYSFIMDDLNFRFEKDFTSTAYLYCNDEKIASASPIENELVRTGIMFKLFHADDMHFVAILATLYQALFAINT